MMPQRRLTLLAIFLLAVLTSHAARSQSVDKCGQIIKLAHERTVEIASPLDAKTKSYPNGLNECSFVIQNQNELDAIAIEFVKFNLQEPVAGAECADYLEIGKGSDIGANSHSKLCGSALPEPVVLENGTVWINFHTDQDLAFDGFRLRVSSFRLAFNESSAEFASPNFAEGGSGYLNNLDLVYKVTAAPDSLVLVRFESLELEHHQNECQDYVTISADVRNARASSVDYLGKRLCKDVPKELVFDADQVSIRLTTDESEQRAGFVVSYSTVKYLYTEARGEIVIAEAPGNMTYNIVAPKDKKIEVTVTQFEFDECTLDSSAVSLQPSTNSFCQSSSDQLSFVNDFEDFGSKFGGQVAEMISENKNSWVYCGCNRPVRTLVSLTNRLNVSYHSVNNLAKNTIVLSYRFIQARFQETNQLRIVQDQTRTFIGGFLLTVQVPANHHLRLSGQSSICAFPKRNLFAKQVIGKKQQAHGIEKSSETLCSYLFDVSEPWTNMIGGENSKGWQAMWYLNFEQPGELHNFEINWSFLPNKIVDQTDKSWISLPLQSGFKFSEELFFNFRTSQLSRRYALNLTAKLASSLDASRLTTTPDDMPESYLKITNLVGQVSSADKSPEEMKLLLTNIFTGGKLIRLNSTNVLINVMRNNDWSMNVTYQMESALGECDFDESICNYTASPLVESSSKSLLYEEASKPVAQLRHVPKYELLNLNHQSTDEKIRDFYLSIVATPVADLQSAKQVRRSVYSPLIRVQPTTKTASSAAHRNATVAVSHKVFSVSFDYRTRMHENGELDEMEMFLLPERADMRFSVKPNLGEVLRYYTSPATLDAEPFVRVTETCEPETFKSLLVNSKAQTMRAEEPGFYWRHANNITVFSCFDFRIGFAAKFHRTTKNTEMKAGIDNVQISYSQDAEPCPEDTCGGRGKCLRFLDNTGVVNEMCCCDPGFTGKNCQEKKSACELVAKRSPTKTACLNGGICVDDAQEFDYKCECAPGYTGKNCETEINECQENSCDINEKCLDLIGGFRCACTTNCKSNDTDACVKVCDRANTRTCFTQSDKTVCICKPGFEGETCSKPTQTCLRNMCAQGSTCVSVKGEEACLCPPTKTGQFCEITVSACEEFKDRCQNGGKCLDASPDGLRVNCSCPLGFTGPLCQTAVNHCEPNPCNGGECVSLLATYNCTCPKGKTGRDCEHKLDDVCYLNPCGENGDCMPAGPSDFRCVCRNGYRGDRCDVIGCDMKKFFADQCNANGTLKVVDFTGQCECKCKLGYTGERCDQKKNLCKSNTINCGGNGVCREVEGEARVECACNKGFHGQFCEKRDNPCKDRCVHGTCDIGEKGTTFACTCIDGWSGENCDKHSRGCDLQKDCVAEHTLYLNTTVNGCHCHCRKGFKGERCEENISDCLTMGWKCENNSTCVDLVSSFKCKCKPGFGGTFCNQQLKDCALRPCKFGTCVEGGNCVCIEGYTGDACDEPEDRCSPVNPCKNKGVCHSLKDRYICECPYEYGQTKDCSIRIRNPCEPSPCLNNGTCNVKSILVRDRSVLVKGSSSIKPIYEYDHPTCTCLPGFYGERCERSSSPCDSNPCKNNGYCMNEGKAFKCVCTPTFQGKTCETFYDVCSPLPCGGASKNSRKCYASSCPSGKCFEPQCLNRGECLATPEGPRCVCRSGFNGTRCEQPFDMCKTMTCLNGGKCVIVDSLPRCQCASSNYTGSRCEVVVSEIQGVEKRFNAVSDGYSKKLSKSCNVLGNETTIMTYVFASLIIFAIIVAIMIAISVYVHRQLRKTIGYHGKVYPAPPEMNELTEKFV